LSGTRHLRRKSGRPMAARFGTFGALRNSIQHQREPHSGRYFMMLTSRSWPR
jgi:hypothetical protein